MLPRHVPVVDLGPGRLHGGREPPPNQRKKAGGEGKGNGHHNKKGGRSKKNNVGDEDNDNDTHLEPPGVEGTLHSPLPRRVSVGNVEDRVRAGKTAVWGGRDAPEGCIRGGGGGKGGGGGDWWDTGTPYAFQPRLAADKTTVLSFVGTGGRRGRGGGGLDQGAGLRANGGGGDDDSVASGLSVHNQQAHGVSRELMRIVKVPESNEHHGQRVFFLA